MNDHNNSKIKVHKNKKNLVGDEIPNGMLSSPQIKYCIDKYHIITGAEEYCVGPASYGMRLGKEVITWDDGKKIEFYLGDCEDKNANIFKSFELQPNSLTYITTEESFNLPANIIARFNLKVRFVHLGLLLGTGPIVDPEYKERLFIPIHNFSNRPVSLNYLEKIINVEFTKTLNPYDKILASKNYNYVENEHKDVKLETFKKNIGRVESSVRSQFLKMENDISEIEKKTKWTLISGVALGVAVLAVLITGIYTVHNLISDANKYVSDASMIFKKPDKEYFDIRNFTTRTEEDKLKNDIKKLKEKIINLTQEIEYLKENQNTSSNKK